MELLASTYCAEDALSEVTKIYPPLKLRVFVAKKMLLKLARTAYWKTWAAKHEYDWSRPWPCCEGESRKYGRTEAAVWRGNWSCKEAVCRKDFSILVGRTKTSAKDVTKKKARRSTGSAIVHVGTKSDVGSQEHQGSGREPVEQGLL